MSAAGRLGRQITAHRRIEGTHGPAARGLGSIIWADGDYYRYFPPSTPKAAKGGIKAQSRRGAFSASWWAKRWIAVLESFPIGARLDRSRSYARRGQVLDLEIDKGAVSAKVQGSRRTPYRVEIGIQPLPRATWRQAIKTLSAQFGQILEWTLLE